MAAMDHTGWRVGIASAQACHTGRNDRVLLRQMTQALQPGLWASLTYWPGDEMTFELQ